jgi:hypothetical protein
MGELMGFLWDGHRRHVAIPQENKRLGRGAQKRGIKVEEFRSGRVKEKPKTRHADRRVGHPAGAAKEGKGQEKKFKSDIVSECKSRRGAPKLTL